MGWNDADRKLFQQQEAEIQRLTAELVGERAIIKDLENQLVDLKEACTLGDHALKLVTAARDEVCGKLAKQLAKRLVEEATKLSLEEMIRKKP
jgi:hypothetical protein